MKFLARLDLLCAIEVLVAAVFLVADVVAEVVPIFIVLAVRIALQAIHNSHCVC
jgi:hypothetical protein